METKAKKRQDTTPELGHDELDHSPELSEDELDLLMEDAEAHLYPPQKGIQLVVPADDPKNIKVQFVSKEELEPNFDPKMFALLIRMYVGAFDIELTEVARRLNEVGYTVSFRTLSRWYHGQMKRIPFELPHFLAKATGVSEGYWRGVEGMQINETVGIGVAVTQVTLDYLRRLLIDRKPASTPTTSPAQTTIGDLFGDFLQTA